MRIGLLDFWTDSIVSPDLLVPPRLVLLPMVLFLRVLVVALCVVVIVGDSARLDNNLLLLLL